MISIRRNKSTIRNKLTFCYTVLFVAVLGAICLTSYLEQRDQATKNVEEELRQSVSAVVNLVGVGSELSIRNYLRGNVEKNFSLTEYFYQLYRSGQISEDEAKSSAARILSSQSLGESGYVYCLQSNGIIAAHSQSYMRGRDLSNIPYVQEQINRKQGYISFDWRDSSELRATPKSLYMMYFAPWDWIITSLIYPREFTNLIDTGDFLPSLSSIQPVDGKASVYILDSLGRYLIAPKPTAGTATPLGVADAEVVSTMLRERTGLIRHLTEDVIAGERRYYLEYFTYMPEYDWLVAVGGYEDELYAPLTEYIRYLVGLMIVGGALGFLLSWLLSTHITGPLRRLKDQLRSAAKGNLNARALPETNDEIGAMSEDFNALMVDITEQAYSLEKLVDARTSDYREQIGRLQKESAEHQASEEVVSDRLGTYVNLINSIPNLICTRNLDDRYVACNDSYARIFLGMPKNVIVGKAVEDFPEVFGPQLQQKIMQMDHRVVKNDVGYLSRNLTLKCADGKVRTFCCTTAARKNSQGEILGVVNILTDISYLELDEEVIY